MAVVAVSALGRPLRTSAQAGRPSYRIGFLSPLVQPKQRSDDPLFRALAASLSEQGFAEGRNVVFEARWAGGDSGRMRALASELARLQVDVIVTGGPGATRAAFDATKTIPIVMSQGSADPIAEGLAASLAHPGGRVTGLAYAVSPERFGKELEYLKTAAPAISRIAVLWDLDPVLYQRTIQTPLETAASRLGVAMLPHVPISDAASVDAAFAEIRKQRADALLILQGGPAGGLRGVIAANALANHLPSVAAFRPFAEAGVLLTYGPDQADLYRRVGPYVGKILNGAAPGDLPIELPRSDVLVVNLRTARALGLTIPHSLLLRADDRIE